jgi:multicomponent Na+:H+ antiporter subunit C
MNDLFAITTGILFGLGVFQLLRRDLIKTAMGYYLLFTAVNFLLLAVGVYDGNTPAYVESYEHADEAHLYLSEAGELQQSLLHEAGNEHEAVRAQPSDPLVQALILTAIVISFGSYALLLGMINVASKRYETANADEVNKLIK